MFLDSYWHKHLAEMGNAPGAQQGDVVIHLAAPIGGEHSFRVPSASVAAAAEGGSFLGLLMTLPDGRRMFVPAGSVPAVIDAPTG